eukprot:654002-Pleurochrysis_carterae.AAC.1
MSELHARLIVEAKETPLRKLLKYERSPFWVTDMRYERDKSGQIFSFPWVDMGNLGINKESPVCLDELSQNIVSLRPSRVILTVLQVNIKHYWPNSCIGWEPHHTARHDRKCEMALSMLIAGPVDSLATDPRAQPAHTHMTCNLPVRR